VRYCWLIRHVTTGKFLKVQLNPKSLIPETFDAEVVDRAEDATLFAGDNARVDCLNAVAFLRKSATMPPIEAYDRVFHDDEVPERTGDPVKTRDEIIKEAVDKGEPRRIAARKARADERARAGVPLIEKPKKAPAKKPARKSAAKKRGAR
jgi:hypothetical protein